MPDNIEFEPESIAPPEAPTPQAMRELDVFGGMKENSVIVRLWGGGRLSFNPNSHAPIFSIIALLAILVTMLLLALIGIWIPKEGAEWFEKLTSALGYGITGIIGAMVGTAAASRERDRD